jgi:hypothetical protein
LGDPVMGGDTGDAPARTDLDEALAGLHADGCRWRDEARRLRAALAAAQAERDEARAELSRLREAVQAEIERDAPRRFVADRERRRRDGPPRAGAGFRGGRVPPRAAAPAPTEEDTIRTLALELLVDLEDWTAPTPNVRSSAAALRRALAAAPAPTEETPRG